MKSILLTGGLGYIGGRLAIELVAAKYKIYCGTRHPNPIPPKWLPQMQMIQLDWNSEKSIQKACSKVQAIIHLAGMNENDSDKDPIAALQSNGLYSLILLEKLIF